MDYDIDPKILEEIRRLSLSSDVKFNRFFSDLTPETKNVLETIIRHYIPGVKSIKRMIIQKYSAHDKGRARITDIEIEMVEGENIWVEMQNWNEKKEEVAFRRWEDLRHLQLKKAKGRKCYLFVLFNTKESEEEYKIWNGFRDVESVRYSMKPDYHDPQMDEEFFPEEADGVIMLLNTEKLSKRSDALGDIFSDLLVSGNVELKNKDMEKRRKEVFTEEEVRKMCYEEQKLVEKFAEKIAEEIAEKKRIPDIKFMASRGISAEDISEATQLPLEKVKKILETE